MSWNWTAPHRTLADDARDHPVEPDPAEHVHFHQHGGERHAHSHGHWLADPDPHAHSSRDEATHDRP